MPRSGINKRKRSIQQRLDQQVLEEAEHEARLEESQLEDEFDKPENTILANRKRNLELQEQMDETRKKVTLKKIDQNIKATLERFDYAKASLSTSAAAKIKKVEDDHEAARTRQREASHREGGEEEAGLPQQEQD